MSASPFQDVIVTTRITWIIMKNVWGFLFTLDSTVVWMTLSNKKCLAISATTGCGGVNSNPSTKLT